MNSKVFLKALRTIIREEVRTAIRHELNEHTEPKKSHTEVIDHGMRMHKQATQSQKQYVKNPMLNDILNETSAMPSDEWSTINFRSEMAQAFGLQNGEPVAVQDVSGNAISTDVLKSKEGGEAVVNALTRDYSSLMKAMNKKK